MQGYNPGLHGQHHAVAHSSGTLQDRGSPTGSDDDAGWFAYPEPHKTEAGLDDDSNAALTSQTLNADGTPKRPMNAFMIFARRRRPQVAAENQSMRTGEVSKLLSREWNGMGMSEKQFYLDQAKILKDNFNQKYPDYVYRRRPNNSRKRRKPDPTPNLPADQASTSDTVDDYSGSADFGDVSPVDLGDTDDPRFSGQDDVRYASLPADPAGETYPTAQSQASSHQPPDVAYRPLGDTRVSYTSRPGRATPDTAMAPSVSSVSRGPDSHGTNYYHPYLSAQQQHHAQSSTYYAESSSTEEVWSGARDDQSRVQIQSWPQNNQGVDDRHRGYPQPGSSHGWTTTGGSEGISSSTSSGAPTTSYGFPTLNSPFYPTQSGAQAAFSSSSSVRSISVSSPHYGATSIPGNPVSARSYPTLQQAYSSASSTTIDSYQQQQQPQARAIPATHPPGQAISYPHTQSTNTLPPTGSGGDSSQVRYWPRER